MKRLLSLRRPLQDQSSKEDRRSTEWLRLKPVILFLLVTTLLLGTASVLRAATVTAMWNANTEADMAGYKLSFGTQSGVYSTMVDVGNVTSGPLTLTGGQRYYFAVQAYNTSAMTSAYSAEVFFDVPVSTPPGITSLSPTSGPVGTSVTITGTNFGTTGTVRFNGTSAAPTSWGSTSIVVPVPATATTGPVVVTVGSVASNGATFTVTGPTPGITSLSPTSGPVGTSVTITGTNFGTTGTVRFNGTTAAPTSWGSTSIVVPVPATATTGPVVVTVGSVASNGVSFTVGPPTPGAITLVQKRSLAGSGTAVPLAFASSNTAGNFIAVAVRIYGTNQTITVSDSRANVYQQAVKFNNGVNDTLGIYYAQNIAGGANTVTASNATSSASIRVAILEYAGIATAGALDVTKTNTLQNAAPTSGNVTTTANGDLLLGVFSTADPGTFTAGSGYTIRETNDAAPSTRLMVEDRIQATAGTTSVTAVVGASVRWGAALAAFRKMSSSSAPTLTQPATQTSAENTTVSLQLVASDPEGSALTYSATGLPPALGLNTATGMITGTLTFASAGTYSASVTVSDGLLTDSKTFTWTVLNVNRAPTLTQPPNQTSAENTTISLPLVASDPDGNALTYSATGLPASLSVISATGVIAGTLTSTSAGVYTVTATASDGSLANSKTFTWTVTDVPQTPTITSLSPTSGPVGTAVTIAGTNFGASSGGSTVRFNGTPATPTSWGATSIVVPVPATATTGPVVVTVGSVASNGVSFTVGPPTPGAITLVQKRSLAGSGTAVPLAFASSNTAGNFIAVAVRIYGTNQTITVSDSRANVYQQAVKFNNGVNDTLGIYYAQNIAGGANTVTASNATSSASIRVAILEYAGIATAGALDVTKTNTLQNAAPTSGNVTTTANGDLLLGVFSTAEPGTFTAGSGYTIRETNDAAPSTRLMVEDRIQATAGTTSVTAVVGASVRWGAALAAFKPASSGAASATLASETLTRSSVLVAASQPPVAPRSDDDYDGDGKADVTVYTPSTGTWSILESSTGTAVTATLGAAGDRPVPGDYDGDGKTDIAVYHPATAEWSVLLSSTGALTVVAWGSPADLPVPADYDRDGKTDRAIYRPASGEWIILQSSTQTTRTAVWGSSADVPVPGDYDGDAKADLAVYRRSTGLWQMLQSATNTTLTATWGSEGDIPIPGDYDGDGATDVAVYHAPTGLWSILQSSTNTMRTVIWGSGSDVPISGDYDGDGTTDLAVFRASTGLWQILQSSTNTTIALTWGTSTDISVP